MAAGRGGSGRRRGSIGTTFGRSEDAQGRVEIAAGQETHGGRRTVVVSATTDDDCDANQADGFDNKASAILFWCANNPQSNRSLPQNNIFVVALG